MKYIVLLGDGMSDEPIAELNGKTPLQAAVTKAFDKLAPLSMVGLVKTIPDGMPPGSDTANLSVLGYDPQKYYSGRSPLEAVSMGINMACTDVAYRCNLVTLDVPDGRYDDAVILDHSADEITTPEGVELIEFVNAHFATESLKIYGGISYRHCLILHDAEAGSQLTPPHDILMQPIRSYLPQGTHAELFYDLQKRSYELLKEHPVNLLRMQKGLKPANSLWFWGEGRKPMLPAFRAQYGLSGAVISAVDLIKGIGLCADMQSIDVPGATGNIHTDFRAKANAALAALQDGIDFVYIHVEAPDESGHRNELQNKVLSIEKIDAEMLTPMLQSLNASGEDYSILVLPDHPTPLRLRTHTSDPVPFMLYRSNDPHSSGMPSYDESSAAKSGIYFDSGPALMKYFLNA
ncbi:MAG: cofactor-independent phosphoglycerate mutase [Christensenellales bacterium]